MSRAGRDDKNLADLDELIEEITVDAYGDDEELWAFRQAFEDSGSLPSDGFVIGEPVSVIEIGYDAICHYEVGLRIGELSLGERFEGVLRWGHVDNRPFSALPARLRIVSLAPGAL
jgi:hypothetical protein